MLAINITPKKITSEIMEHLEAKGLIIRLTPAKENHRLEIAKEVGVGEQLYKSAKNTGSHSLVNIAMDNTTMTNFGTHPDNEEFLLLGGIKEKRLYLLVALMLKDELSQKIATGTLTSDDFICLEVVFNDPKLSFFVMKKNVPHGECTFGTGRPATFYVTEGSELGHDKTEFGDYQITVSSDKTPSEERVEFKVL